MDAIKFRRTVSLVTSAALITSLTVAAFAAPAAAKSGEQQLDAQQARAEVRAEAKAAREVVKQARAVARTEAKAAREAAKQARAVARTEAKAARQAAKQAKSEKVTICHKPGTPAEGTLEISASAVQAHVDHGDPAPGDEAAACGEAATLKLIICEEPGTLDGETSTAAGTDEDDGVACDEAPQVLVSIDAPESIEPQDVLQLQGAISGLEASDLSYLWSSTCLTNEELTDPTIIAGDPDTALLIIREDILTAGTTCDFTLTVTGETSGADGSATVTVEVVLLP